MANSSAANTRAAGSAARLARPNLERENTVSALSAAEIIILRINNITIQNQK